MRKRSARWQLETMTRPCRCGSLAQHRFNVGSKETQTYRHNDPSGAICPFWKSQDDEDRTRRICEKAGVPF